MSTQLRRDSFARATLIRVTLPSIDRGACRWCDQPGKYLYQWQHDGSRGLNWTNALSRFCSVACWEAYTS